MKKKKRTKDIFVKVLVFYFSFIISYHCYQLINLCNELFLHYIPTFILVNAAYANCLTTTILNVGISTRIRERNLPILAVISHMYVYCIGIPFYERLLELFVKVPKISVHCCPFFGLGEKKSECQHGFLFGWNVKVKKG